MRAAVQNLARSRRYSRAVPRWCSSSSINNCRTYSDHTHHSRPLRSRFEGWLDGEHLECQQEKEAQNHPKPGEAEPKIVADGTQDEVGGIAGATSEIAAAEMTLRLHMSDHRLDRGAPSELAFNAAEDPALLA